MSTPPKSKRPNFKTIAQVDLPRGRRGKHFEMLTQVLQDLEQLPSDQAIKIPLAEFPGNTADIRSAIARATAKLGIEVTTSSDDEFFYVWKRTQD